MGLRAHALKLTIVAGLATGVTAGLVVLDRGGEAGATAARPRPPRADPPPVRIEAVTRPATPIAEPDAGPATELASPRAAAVEPPAAEPPARAAASGAREVVVSFRVEPDDAVVTVDGDRVRGDLRLRLTGGSRRIHVEARASGYRPYRSTHTVDGDDELTIRLRKKGASGAPSGPGGRIAL